MKRDFLKIRKRLIVGCLAAAIAVAQPVSSVFANPHYDRRDTVAEEEFIYSARTSGTESSRVIKKKSELQSMEKDQRCLL